MEEIALQGFNDKKGKNLFYDKPLMVLFIFLVTLSFVSPRFFSLANLLNILRQTSINAVISAGMTFVVLTGGIDLSVGAILAFSGAISAALLISGYSAFVAILIPIIIGGALGAVSGILVSVGGLQPFITTLVVMTFMRGATLVFMEGGSNSLGSENGTDVFEKIGSGSFLGIPVPVYIMALIYLAAHYTLNHTRFGRYVYALGGNEEATRLSGINVQLVKINVYIISGLLSALGGIIVTARLLSAQPTAGNGYELDAIAAVVLGGTSLSGGRGKIQGTLIGVMIIGILSNLLNLLNVSSYYQMMIKAVVILTAVLVDKKLKK